MRTRVEFESEKEVLAYLESNSDLSRAVFQSLNLDELASHLKQSKLYDNVLLGCTASAETLALFKEPLVFPQIPNLPFNPFRSSLYTAEELLGAYEVGNPESYQRTVDGAVYKKYKAQGGAGAEDVMVSLAKRLHDHAIEDALQEFIKGKRLVAIMGGHSMLRNDPMYLEVARLSRDLSKSGFFPLSGGGPGAMEATHLGTWFTDYTDEELIEAVKLLAEAPLYKPLEKWLDTAFTVMNKFPRKADREPQCLGIPTWLYGHEPPTPFAGRIAKYFANSVREEGLLAIAMNGVVFTPGSAGTIQEVFQDATQNHYKSFGKVSPMIFFGEKFWTEEKPVYPLLKKLAEGKEYDQYLSISDSRDEIIGRLQDYREDSRS